ncbi:MAG TPA: trypsin-like peptidase domain-containing protein [Candidatus Polarisedimenticolaceae bacterium]|nr:trypsin-like peptidase domain-containing protein [Candidatus Polarisedimenticolaceae bacterium]
MKSWAKGMVLALVLLSRSARADSLSEVFKRVSNSVVEIHATERTASGAGLVGTDDEEIGSGVLIEPDRVLTAAHVVQVATRIVVDVAGESLRAQVVASETGPDLAVLKLERAPMKASVAKLGDSSAVQVGDEVFIVGAPLGMSKTLSVGHISGRRAAKGLLGGMLGAELFQTDASINPGNSGGPMFDMNGNVIGVVSHIIFQEAGAGGLGFVVTSNLAKELVLSGQTFWSGMEGVTLEGDMARIFQLPQPRGILVQRIAEGSPAARLGLLPGNKKAMIGDATFLVGGDVILAVQGIDVSDDDAGQKIREALSKHDPSASLSVVVLRGGRRIELELRASR